MGSSANRGEAGSSEDGTNEAQLLGRALAIIEQFRFLETSDAALALLGEATAVLGAECATFLCFIRDDALLSSYRCLHVGDPAWSAEYARGEWFADEPWLEYAMHESEPVRAHEVEAKSPRHNAFIANAAELGYAGALIVPSPSPQGQSRVGVLYLGSSVAAAFDGPSYPTVRLLARSLAMELHGWMRRSIRDDLMRRANITSEDIDLLRHELAGHSSKVIATTLNTEAKTIDCRFQRVSAKLGAPNRRSAVRVAKLYGLL
jgi:Autoinducer binding domain